MNMSSALSNAVSGLTATARRAGVVSSNLSNALTEGYARREVALEAAQIGGTGGGVRIAGITRVSDPRLLADRRLADAARSGDQQQATAWVRLETALGDVTDPAGLAARFAAFERALISAGSDPAAGSFLTAAVSRLSQVTDTLQSATRSTQALRQDADTAIARDVDRLNNGLRQVADLNKDIQRLSASGADPSGLQDARQKLIDDLATIVPLRERLRDDGSVSLITTSGTTLLDGRPVTLDFTPTATITADQPALPGLVLHGVALDPAIGKLGGGSLGAHFATRDQTMVAVQDGLDRIAADLAIRFQDSRHDPTLPPGSPGLLTDQGAAFDPAQQRGLAGRIALNAALDPAKGGNPGLLRDGLRPAAAGLSGSSAQLTRWIDALNTPRDTGAGPLSAAGQIAEFTASLGQNRIAAQETASFSAAKADHLRNAALAQGVDTDAELQMLLRIEQSYAANAKVIAAVDAMLQRLMEI